MIIDADTFLTTVYVTVDDFCAAYPHRIHPGRHPIMSDSEVLTVLLLKPWHGTSERGVLAWIAQTYAAYFPTSLTPSAFNRRARALAPLMGELLLALAEKLAVWQEAYEIIDGLPIPVASTGRGRRRRCFTPVEADIGRGGVGKDWYYGVSLLGCVSASGVMTGFVTTPANCSERWAANALMSWRANPTAVPVEIELSAMARKHSRQVAGPRGHLLSPTTAGETVTGVYLADQGFKGASWQETWRTRCGATVITQDHVMAHDRHWFHDARQRIETVFATLTDVLHIKYPRARSEQGLIMHLVSVCTALNLGIYINRLYGRDDLRLGTLFRG